MRKHIFVQGGLLCNYCTNFQRECVFDPATLKRSKSNHTHSPTLSKKNKGALKLSGVNNYCKSYAFTLIEMLMALLVVSIILAALAPVITKRFYNTQNRDKVSSENSALLVYDDSNGVKYPTGKAAASLKQTSPGVIEFTNTDSNPVELTLTIQGAGGGGGGYQRTVGLTRTSYSTTVPNSIAGSTTENQNVTSTTGKYLEWRIPRSISNVKVSLTGAGGGGGAGNIFYDSTLVCGNEEYTIPSSKNGNMGTLCIKKYNIGDIPSLLPSTANLDNFRDLSTYNNTKWGGVPVDTIIVPSYASEAATGSASNTCWYAKNRQTAGTCTNASGYSGCYRTICTHDVSAKACSILEPAGQWRLPTMDEARRWRENPTTTSLYQSVGIVTSDASDFCDNGTNAYGAARCNRMESGSCPGAQSEWCNPAIFWSSSSQWAFSITSGQISGPGSYSTSSAYSARCVRSLFIPYYGAGGSGGGTLQNIEFKNLQYDDRLYFYVGGGGTRAPSVGATASSGEDSWVEHQRYNGSDWVKVEGTNRYIAGGGGAGSSASTSAHGLKGTGGSCSPVAGCIAGTAASDWKSNSSTAGGASTLGSGAASSGAESINGRTSYNFGAGGSGAFTNSDSAIGEGGNGGAGYATIIYNIASTGSGGGAGGYLGGDIKIKVSANSKLVFTIGKGGEGSVSSNALNGGDTIVHQDSTILYRAQGGTGGKYTSLNNATSPLAVVSILAVGGLGGRIYEKTADKSNAQMLSEISGKNATYTTGGNGGLSKSDNREPSFGGCAQVNEPLSFSDCISNKMPVLTSSPLYDKGKVLAKGGGGGGGAGCDDTSCSAGATGADGFVTVSW